MSVAMNIVVEQGADYSNTITVTDDAGAPLDLTNYTFQAMMRRSFGSTSAYIIDVSSPTPASGTILFGVTSAVSGTWPAGRYVYDIYMYSPAATPIATRVVEGIVTVTPGVVGPGGLSQGIITGYGPTGPTGPTSTVPGPTGATGPIGVIFHEGATAPVSPNSGDYWFDTTTGIEYIWLYDGDGYQWVEASASAAVGDTVVVADQLILPKEVFHGIQIDIDNPNWGWHDLVGSIEVRSGTANSPSFIDYTGTHIKAFAFSANTMNECFIVYHVPHDYVPGTAIHMHVHWSNAAVTPDTGDVIWGFEYMWAQGYSQQVWQFAPIVLVTQPSSSTRYMHQIIETGPLTLAGLEVDSLICVRVFRDASNVLDTCLDQVFAHMSDIHYQSTNMATKNKNVNFYT